MVIRCRKNMFELDTNFKDAFIQTIFEEYYLEDCFDKYKFIVGDLSDSKLRLKGFNDYNRINDYIFKSCAFEAPYYILSKINTEEEFLKLKELNKEPKSGANISHFVLEKENFDKDSLVLESSQKHKPSIVLDINRINSIYIGKLPDDLKTNNEVEEKVVSTISSNGFVPNKNRVPNKKKRG